MRFVDYLLEEERKIYAKKRTPEEIESIPNMSSSNIEEVFRIGDVVFDQVNGLGAVPNNQNVVYRGFVGMMLPKDFSAFALRADRSEDAKSIVHLMRQGYGVGSPFFQLDIKDIENPVLRIVGHEGRARCVAINSIQPNVAIPVHFFLVNELRARHINDQIVSSLNTSIRAEGTDTPVRNKIQSIWLNGKHIKL